MTQTEALKLALEALKRVLPHAKESMTNTELDIDILDAHAAITAIEARLSPQNELEAHWNEVRASYGARQAALEAKDEPVAWMDASRFEELRNGFTVMTTLTKKKAFFDDVAIYTTLPQRKPLTNQQIAKILEHGDVAESNDKVGWYVLPYSFARAIEAAHGIKGEA